MKEQRFRSAGSGSGVLLLDPAQIDVHDLQPRGDFREEEGFKCLVEDLKTDRQYQAAAVWDKGNGRYGLVFGHRRREAAILAGVKLRCELREIDPGDRDFALGRENAVRNDWSPAEWAHYIQQLRERYPSLTVAALCSRVGLSSDQLKKLIQLMQLPPDVQDALRQRLISAGHARVLGRVAGVEQRRELVEQIRAGLSVHALEAAIKASPQTESTSDNGVNAMVVSLQMQLRQIDAALSVEVCERLGRNGAAQSWALVLTCSTPDTLVQLIERFSKIQQIEVLQPGESV